MDPFSRLPWFVLQDILSLLPDLPTLHRLHNASPAIAAFLHQQNGLFPEIIETIISHTQRDKGLLPQSQVLVRTLVFIWWRTCSADLNTELNYGANPLPSTYKKFFDWFRFWVSYREKDGDLEDPWEVDPSYGGAPLPRSTPPIVLCRLLAFSSRLRQIVHSCFHGMVSNCIALKPGHQVDPLNLRERKGEWRPAPKPYTPIDIGPPSWVEEQRLIRSFLFITLFFELRHAMCAHDLYCMEKAVPSLNDDRVDEFWCRIMNTPHEPLKMKTAVMWLAQEGGSVEGIEQWMIYSSISENLTYCCPNLTPLTAVQLSWTEEKMFYYAPGTLWAGCCRIPNYPTRLLGREELRPFGIDFWILKGCMP